ncbi:MAG: glycosyltransferase family 4 protein [Thermodesulfobacteriota bacterium]|nr:glycosyltransferase family 4 protein [Thermodesulfobacteriota bacterium]
MLTDVLFPDTIGGAGRIAYHLSDELSAKGYEVHIITRNVNEALQYHQRLKDNLHVHRFATPGSKSPFLIVYEILGSYLLSKALTQEIRFDLVCIHQSLVAIGPILSRLLKETPIVYYFHSPWHEEFLAKKWKGYEKMGMGIKAIAFLMRWIERRILSRAGRVFVLSRYMCGKVKSIHSFPEKNITIIPGGVDLNRFILPSGGKTAAKGACGLSPDKTVFLTVRNLVPRMGLETLIEAFSASSTLREKGLLLIGGKGLLHKRLKSMVKDHDLIGSVRLLGHIPDENLPAVYQAADFFLLPTRELEGFGLVILEAMACGTPVLGTPIGAIPEVIELFDQKLIFDGTGREDMKRKMEETIQRPGIYNFSPESCRRFVLENFSWEKVADFFEKTIISMD